MYYSDYIILDILVLCNLSANLKPQTPKPFAVRKMKNQ